MEHYPHGAHAAPTALDLRALAAPFHPDDIEWRLGMAGKSGERFWGLALAYITNRAIMERLDEVCGPNNWKNEYIIRENEVLCGLSIRVLQENGTIEWVTKWDGAEQTDIEAVKGGLSSAMKRAGVQWGIGRYLYGLDESYVTIADSNDRSAKPGQTKQGEKFRWYPPKLPEWALPDGAGSPRGQREHEERLAYIKETFKTLQGTETAVVAGQSESLKPFVQKHARTLPGNVTLTRELAQAIAQALQATAQTGTQEAST